jgi:transcriptional antiterminator RfaH
MWYCLRSQLKHEHIAAAHLRQIEHVDVYCPRVRLQKSTRRGRIWFTEALFPNYLFARFNLRALLTRVRSSPGVVGLVRFGGGYPSVPTAAIESLRAVMLDSEMRTIVPTISEGDAINVVEGPLQGAPGVVTKILPAQERVRVLLDFLGGTREVEFGLSALFKPAPSLLDDTCGVSVLQER